LGLGVTQVRSLSRAEQQVRDYIETLLDVDASRAAITIVPDLGSVQRQVDAARRRTRAAEEAQRTAADEMRRVVVKLRASGLSVNETATVMGFSPGRVSQIVKKASPATAARTTTAAARTAASASRAAIRKTGRRATSGAPRGITG
jgi:DNA-directed RNA polymerase specialized sigma24 family protein